MQKRQLKKRRRSVLAPLRAAFPAITLGLLGYLSTPLDLGRADLATFLAGINRPGNTWQFYMTKSPAGSIQMVDMVFADPIVTGAIRSGAGVTLPTGEKIAFRAKDKLAGFAPDEDRVNRSDKSARILSVTPVQPPKDFSAGSVLQRQSGIMDPVGNTKQRLAFAKPKFEGKELEIATVFYPKKEIVDSPGVPVELASLVTNPKADMLATAYAEPAPDYARESPFDSILTTEKDPSRFIPPISAEDHAWAANPLPPIVFTEAEQKCLTNGIYFEARGEALKGQAAVGQVILNRVRNPAYPNTICGVVYQNKTWYNECQFSFACDRIPDIVWSPDRWQVAKDIAMAVTAGKIWLPEVGSSTHYHATYVKPDWAPTMKKLTKIGLHVFYRTYGGGWS